MQLGKFTMTKVDPMYPTELISMVEKGKLVKLNKMNNLNSSINLQVHFKNNLLIVLSMCFYL